MADLLGFVLEQIQATGTGVVGRFFWWGGGGAAALRALGLTLAPVTN